MADDVLTRAVITDFFSSLILHPSSFELTAKLYGECRVEAMPGVTDGCDRRHSHGFQVMLPRRSLF